MVKKFTQYDKINMKISIIIPTYKPKEYLWECLYSVKNQTFPKSEYEVIIILNGCTSPWKEQIDKYISCNMQEINVIFINTEKGGVSNARNIALDIAKGDYIAFIDDDDFISPLYLEELYSKASEDTIPVCYPLSFIDGTQDYKPYLITRDYIHNEGKGKCNYRNARKFFSGPVYKLINRKIIGNRRFDKRFCNGEDSLFMFLISDKFRYVDFTTKNAVYYRRFRKDSAVSKKRSRWNIINNELKRMWQYTFIFFSSPFNYSFNFYITRMLGAIRSMIE